MTATVGAVVTGASYRALAVVRSLGRHGVPVHVVRTDEHAVALRSRYATSTSASSLDQDGLVQHLVALSDRVTGAEGAVLIPTHDEEVAAIAKGHAALVGRYTLTTPPWEQVIAAYDKRALSRLALTLGVAQPWTALPEGPDDVTALAGSCPYPVVVKPAYKTELNALTTAKAWPAADAAELVARYRAACALQPPESLLIQELIPGGGTEQLSFAVLADQGNVLASLSARRTRQYPADFGRASTFVETIPADDVMTKAATTILGELAFTGIAELEFKREPGTGLPLLLDLNPRAWGWISLGGRAGVDFPWLLYLLATGEPVPSTQPEQGVRWVRTSTDTPTALKAMRHGELGVGAWLRSVRPPRELAVFAGDDPLPGLFSPLATGKMLASRVVHRRPV